MLPLLSKVFGVPANLLCVFACLRVCVFECFAIVPSLLSVTSLSKTKQNTDVLSRFQTVLTRSSLWAGVCVCLDPPECWAVLCQTLNNQWDYLNTVKAWRQSVYVVRATWGICEDTTLLFLTTALYIICIHVTSHTVQSNAAFPCERFEQRQQKPSGRFVRTVVIWNSSNCSSGGTGTAPPSLGGEGQQDGEVKCTLLTLPLRRDKLVLQFYPGLVQSEVWGLAELVLSD